VVGEVTESVVKALPDVLMNLQFVHTGAKLGPRTGTEDDCSYILVGEDVVPVFAIVTTETTVFVLASISFMAGTSAPKAIHGFCRDNLTCDGEFDATLRCCITIEICCSGKCRQCNTTCI
jgi:hypothetical protein